MIPAVIVVLLVAVDQVVKYLCFHYLTDTITLIPGFIELRYLENRGAAFGIMEGRSFFLILFPIIIICGLIFYYRKLGTTTIDKITKVSLILILSGAFGNLIDRAFNGFVVDMFNFTFFQFPIFNVADIYVVVGTAILMIATILTKEDK